MYSINKNTKGVKIIIYVIFFVYLYKEKPKPKITDKNIGKIIANIAKFFVSSFVKNGFVIQDKNTSKKPKP